MTGRADRPGVLVIGDVINDVIVRPVGPTAVDTDTGARVTSAPGGSGANQAAWLAALGVPVRLAARVGAADATYHHGVLATAGVEARLAVDTELTTGSIVVVTADDGTRSMYTDRGANRRLGVDDLDAGLLEGVGHVHVSGYALVEPETRAAVRALWRAAADAWLSASVDPGSAAFLANIGAAFLEWTEGADLAFPNLAEGRILAGADDPDDVAGRLLAYFPVVVLKLGQRGAIIRSRAGFASAITGAPEASPVVDPTGAGDAFCAGFLARWLTGDDLAACAASATAAASSALGRVGGRPPTPGRPPTQGPPSGDPRWEQLRWSARQVATNAFAPWSGLHVGAAGLTDDGRVLAACNVENASFGLTLCAECGLVSALRAAGAGGFVAVSVVAGDGQPLAPCGRCRQVLLDNGGPAILIDGGSGQDATPLGDLLPGPFDAAEVERRRGR